MPVVGFDFTKIIAEKKNAVTGQVNISNNITIKDIERSDLSFGKGKQDCLKFSFEFSSKYEPDIGLMTFVGTVAYIGDAKEIEGALKEWKKEKKIAKEMTTHIMNAILLRCNVQAIILSRDINLPPPVPLPKVGEPVQAKTGDDSYIG